MTDDDIKAEVLTVQEYLKSIENIDRATSSVVENVIAIFLPFKRIDKTHIYRKFIENGQVLEIENGLFDKVEIRGRLLGQGHKDILEALLTLPKTYSKKDKNFRIRTTAYELTKRLGRNIGKKKWVIDRLKEIADCRINIYFKNGSGEEKDFNFGIIDTIEITDETDIIVRFAPSYTYFLASVELLDYRDFVEPVLQISTHCAIFSREIGLKRHIDSEFIKAVVRYMLIHRGNNSQIRISKLIEKLRLDRIMSDEELKNAITDLRRPKMVEYLKQTFGIDITNDGKTVTFNRPSDKTHCLIPPKLPGL